MGVVLLLRTYDSVLTKKSNYEFAQLYSMTYTCDVTNK